MPEVKGGKEVRLIKFIKGQEVWIQNKNSEELWQKAIIESQNGAFTQVVVGRRRITLNLLEDAVFPTNPKPQPDMTSLHYINDPCILMNLEERSLQDEPYTFMGNVLVAVNPLKMLPDPKDLSSNPPHPFSVAETALKQLAFAYDHKKYNNTVDESVNQSIVTSGESGAGKTEQCKMVLRHLVERCSNEHSAEIDKQLLESNYITESFGNAQTLRNHNSSRFGKFLKLFLKQKPFVKGHVPDWEISGATVQTYLLERSRVVFHGEGERNYHIFYHLLSGLDASKRSAYGFDEAIKSCGFRYLSALKSNQDSTLDSNVGISAYKKEVLKTDKEGFERTVRAMNSLGFDDAAIYENFKVAAGILHLGNITFDEKTINANDVAVPMKYKGYSPVKWASELLGFENEKVLEDLLLEERLKIRNNEIVKKNNKQKACDIRDAVGKGLYSLLFDNVISIIDQTLNGYSANDDDTPYIGVLDIFGFETFDRNGFEQLLINFANEALQATFNRSVFENEAALYKKERLLLDGDEMQEPPSNTACMELLIGKADKEGKVIAGEVSGGLLLAIDDACQSIEPSDVKMLSRLHRNFTKHENYVRPHPRYKQEKFIIQHFAGKVDYTIGFFVEKNRDRLPKAVQEVFKTSTSVILREIVGKAADSKRNATIVKKFRQEIHDLVETLESTRCSFIRCVKPNFHLIRPNNNKGWFDRKYISRQLRNLSIPQTAEVLQNGFPTRLTYKSLLEQYRGLLPDSAMSRWSKSGGQEDVFVKALFYAFEVDNDIFKLGLTMVFFRSGELAKLDDILRAASNWKDKSKKDKERIIERFIFYYTRMRWRRVFAKLVAVKTFLDILEVVRERERKRREEEERRRKAEEERKKKEAAELAAQEEEERKRLEREQKAEDEFAEEQRRVEEEYEQLLNAPMDEKNEKQKEILQVEQEFVEIAKEEVEQEMGPKEARPSVTSEMIRVAVEERVKNFRKKYAMEKVVENTLNIVESTTETVNKGYHQVVEWVKKFFDDTKGMREDAGRVVRAAHQLFIREARKQPWFRAAHDELIRLQTDFQTTLTEMKNADSRVRNQTRVNEQNLKRTTSYIVLDEDEVKQPVLSSKQYADQLDQQLNDGIIQPSDYAEGVARVKRAISRADAMDNEPINYQYTPKNSDTDDMESNVESIKAPSEDVNGGWCKTPIKYKDGLFYFKPKLHKDGRNFSLECAWEYNKNGKRIKDTWVVQGTAAEFALLYDSILSHKKLKSLKSIPEFPFWKADEYKKSKKFNLKTLMRRKDREEKVEILANCLKEKHLRYDPEAIGQWLEEVFKILYGNVEKDSGTMTNVFFNKINAEFLDCTVYAGIENFD